MIGDIDFFVSDTTEKALVITTTNWLGGKNLFLGWGYIVVGIVCLLFAIVFIVKQLTCPRWVKWMPVMNRKMGDIRYLKMDWSVCWNTKRNFSIETVSMKEISFTGVARSMISSYQEITCHSSIPPIRTIFSSLLCLRFVFLFRVLPEILAMLFSLWL